MGRSFYSKKNTVDDYKSISVKSLKEWSYFAQYFKSGTLTWTRNGEKTGSVGVSVTIEGLEGRMRLNYTYADTDILNYEIRLVSTPCHYGGVRWWFICPILRNGAYCGRRVGVLYFGKYAGCRHCYELTYESCQESHKFDWLAKEFGIPSGTALKRAMGL